MKKLLSVLCVLLILSTTAITVFADDIETTSTDNSKIIETLQKMSDRLAKRNEFLEFRQTLHQKGDTIRQNTKTNLELAAENTQLRKDVVDFLLDIIEDGITVPQDIRNQLKEYNQQIKEIDANLRESNGDIRDIIIANRQNIKDMNYEEVEKAYNEIIAIQQNLAEELTKINNILKDMKDLLSTIE